MTKVLVVATSPKTHGGIATVVKAHKQSEIWDKYNCKWITAHIDTPNFLKVWYFMTGLIKFACLIPFYDIAHIHMSSGISAKRKINFLKIAKFFHKPVVVHMHCGTQIEESWSDEMNYIFTKADVGLMLANRIKKCVAAHTGKVDNLFTCYNPCPPVVEVDNSKRKKHILYAGTICKNKGYHVLIDAFAKIAKKYPDWKVLLAGVGEMDEAKSLIEKYGLNNQIQLLGWISGESKDKYYKEASIFCLPSFLEGFPMAILEAWSYGIAVISTPVGGIPDVAKNGENMLLFNPGDTVALADGLEKLIVDDVLRENLSNESKKMSKDIFNIRTIANQIDKIYESLSTKTTQQ